MKTENDLNAIFSKNLRTMWGMQDGIFHYKPNDRITDGVSDFLIWSKSETLALENKLCKAMDVNSKAKVLNHPFSGAQITFLESQKLVGNKAYGAVYVLEHKGFYLFEHAEIPKTGNWKTDEFLDIISTKEKFITNPEGLKRMLEYVFGRLL